MSVKIDTMVYPNGFHLVHQPAIHNLPLCSIHLYCDVGSSFETNELRGIAHFLEHMLFQGTKDRTPHYIFQEYDRIGTQFNAFTTKRFTCFYVKCHIEHAERVIQLFTDMMQNSSLKKSSIRKEEKVIEQENRSRENNYSHIAKTNFERKVFKQSSFEQPIDNSHFRKNVPKMSQNTLKKWYEWFYQPSNIVLSIVSNKPFHFWTQIMFASKLTKPNFRSKSLQKPVSALSFPNVISHDPYQEQKQTDIIIKQEPNTSNAHLIFGFRTVNQYSDKKYLFDLLAHILNGKSARLFTILRQEQNLVYNIFCSSEEEEFTGYFCISTEFDPIHTKKVILLLFELCKDLVKDGIQEEEFHIAKKRLQGAHQIQYEDINTFAKYNGYEHLLFVRDTENSRHYRKKNIVPYQEVLETYYEPITLEQINALIREYFRPHHMVISLVSPNPMTLAEMRSLCKKYRPSMYRK